ncbi:uncharacterized protein LOC132057976 [Lycium ferocissimum]|uniref:uncharacterized protein LOC132057976 n=1 Tax=Lycium ferocissimum TaxID=112874 RepID=UPI002815C0F7|nr:uncharacterized protein LOC132057976 [Lycium ferocissimum]
MVAKTLGNFFLFVQILVDNLSGTYARGRQLVWKFIYGTGISQVRGLKRRKEAADEEAKLALADYESSLKELEDNNEPKTQGTNISTGRRVFGAQKKQASEQPKKKVTSDNYYGDSDSEGEIDAREIGISAREENNFSEREVHFDPNALREESEIGHDSLFKSFDDIARDPNSRTSYEVSIFAADSWKKMNDSLVKGKQTKSANAKSASSSQITEPVVSKPDGEIINLSIC